MMNTFKATDEPIRLQEHREIDEYLSRLQANKEKWARLSLQNKCQLLQQIGQNLAAQAAHWVAEANAARQIAPDSLWAAEEWYEIFTVARALHDYTASLALLDQGVQPRPRKVWTRPDGQVVAQVFPADLYDYLLFNGISSEVWMQPEVTVETLPQHTGSFYRQPQPSGAVTLILGAGNVNSIAPLDALDRLFRHAQVALLKLSPVNAYLQPLLEAIFAPMIRAGFLAIITGDANIGNYLVHHPAVDEIHVTGSAETYQAIVSNQRNGDLRSPDAPKPITAELGGVTPVIVLPGQWTAADIRFQAENIATMKLYNCGFNCISAQLLVLPEQWPQKQELVTAVQQVMQSLPPQYAYYPGVAQRLQAVQQVYPEAVQLGREAARTIIPTAAVSESSDYCRRTEFFGPMLAVMTLPGETAVSFLQNAVTLCNQSVAGTLGIDLIASPDVLKTEAAAIDTAVAALKYGTIGLNVWCGLGYRITQNPWGAFQSPDAGDVGSGRGVVHNTLLFDSPQKTVLRGRFRPFPRSWRHGDPAFMPKPPWFVTHRQRLTTARRVARFALNPGYLRLPGIFAAALRG
ncbi:MAG: aldehyde dehydrogenase [Chloroflexi bacterium]|nr:aldehyde dehydrogenase [Chloroflexota bacterium]